MKKTIAGLLITSMALSGCTGSFLLTKKVYNFHRSQSDKWKDELVFLVVTLVPVYGLATFADAIVFNSIEFWTGNNPVSTAQVQQHGRQIVVSYEASTDRVAVASSTTQGDASQFTLERTPEGIVAKDAAGQVVMTSAATQDGGIAMYDRDAHLVKQYSKDEVASLTERGLAN